MSNANNSVMNFITDIAAVGIFFLPILVACWLMGSFIELNFNFFVWEPATRIFVIIVALIVTLVARD